MKKLLTLTIVATLLTACGGEKEEEKEEEKTDNEPKEQVEEVPETPITENEGGFKMGTNSVVAIGTENLETSVAFYEKLGFKTMHKHDGEKPSVFMTDNNLVISLNQDGMEPYMGLTYYSGDFASKVAKLKENNSVMFNEWKEGDLDIAVYLSPDSSAGICIVGMDIESMERPTGTTFMDIMKNNKMMDAAAYPNKKCGVFGEYAIPVKDLDASMAYWKNLGFEGEKMSYGDSEYAIMQDGFNTVGLHTGEEFDYNAITFFAPDMDPYIEVLKSEGLEGSINQHPAGGKHYILDTPEGQKIFLFSMSI